jgi:Polysaccharide lyase
MQTPEHFSKFIAGSMRLTLAGIVASVPLTSCGKHASTPVSSTSTAPPGTVLWSADHETGNFSQWYLDDGGGEFNSGAASSAVTDDVAHTGRYSARVTIRTPGTSGARLFRWNESHTNPEAYYGAWFYFPITYRAAQWWNIFQFKSRNDAVVNDAFWALEVGSGPGGSMHVRLEWWNGLSIEGPHRGEFGGKSFDQGLKDIPVAKWTHFEVFLRQSSGFDGQLIVWQDGVELINLRDVRTRYPAANGANEWSVNNYSDAIAPSPTTIYIDDAVISTSRIGR